MADGSLSQFKATLARKLERKEKRQSRSDRNLNYNTSHLKPEFDFPELTESELEKVKDEIKNKIKAEKKKELIITIVVFVAVISIIFYLISHY